MSSTPEPEVTPTILVPSRNGIAQGLLPTVATFARPGLEPSAIGSSMGMLSRQPAITCRIRLMTRVRQSKPHGCGCSVGWRCCCRLAAAVACFGLGADQVNSRAEHPPSRFIVRRGRLNRPRIRRQRSIKRHMLLQQPGPALLGISLINNRMLTTISTRRRRRRTPHHQHHSQNRDCSAYHKFPSPRQRSLTGPISMAQRLRNQPVSSAAL